MTANYMQELAEWAGQKKEKQPRQDKHAVAFLAVRNDVKTALDGGYAMKTIWKHMRETGRISSRYETFTLHVKRFITEARPAPFHLVKADKPAPKAKAKTDAPRQPKTIETMRTYIHNPVPNVEEIL